MVAVSLLEKYELMYKNALLKDVIPFWQKHSIDNTFGGYFTCLDRDGSVYDTDKFVWLQARQVWTFSMLYNRCKKKQEWLEIATLGINFLKKHGRDTNGDWYFSLTKEGKPLVEPYNIFSDCFAALAFGEYALATGDNTCANIASTTYNNILSRQSNPKGKFNKSIYKNRPLKSFSLPMILANLTFELKWMIGDDGFNKYAEQFLSEIMNTFLDKERLLIRENILTNGNQLDSFEGRLINPGHGIEGMGFVMDIANKQGRKEVINQAVEIIISTLEFGWDKEHGGIFCFMDAKGKPPLSLEWDQKLWWVHLEALVSLVTAFSLTGDKRCWVWFEKIHQYTWSHFPDAAFGEWYGYLSRQGNPLLPIKGGKWKGFFHVPRSLFRIWKVLEELKKGEK